MSCPHKTSCNETTPHPLAFSLDQCPSFITTWTNYKDDVSSTMPHRHEISRQKSQNNTSPFFKPQSSTKCESEWQYQKLPKLMPSTKQQIYFSDIFTIKNLRTVGSFEELSSKELAVNNYKM